MDEQLLWDAEGSFTFETLVCQLLRTDIGSAHLVDNELDSIGFDDLYALSASISAASGLDTIMLTELPRGISPESTIRLAHERMHYWQVLSSSLQQERFTLLLDNLRLSVADRDGRPERICGLASPSHADRAAYRRNLAARDSDHGHVRAENVHVVAIDPIPHDLRTDQLFYHTDSPDGGRRPGYAAGMELAGGDIAFVPFTGLYLMESSAYLSECLLAGRPIERLDTHNAGAVRYLGVWEYWCRLHEARFSDTESLVLAFLAAVDLAMMGDPFTPATRHDVDLLAEMTVVPYRFGKLVFRARGIEPLVAGDDPAADVSHYQAALAHWSGWPTPEDTTRRAMGVLTAVLVLGWPELAEGFSEEIRSNVGALFDEVDIADIGSDERWFELLRSVSGIALTPTSRPVGCEVLGMMLNACAYRIAHPGQFAVPHVYHDALREHFPLPLINLDGRYHHDDHLEGSPTVFQRPYVCNAQRVAKDCTRLVPLTPLAKGSRGCGFVDGLTETARCFYGRAGLGCPQLPMSPAQVQAREAFDLDDWCHWTWSAIDVAIASSEVIGRWSNR